MSACLGSHSPRNRASCSHFSIPAPLICLKAISYFSHLIQPIPALCHLLHFSSLPLQDHINTLGCCSCSHALILAPEPCLVASMFLLASAISAVPPSPRSVPASHKTSFKSLWPWIGVYWGSSRQSHFQRKKPTLCISITLMV